MSRLRVAFFTPLPPARTGTADYAASLVAELKNLVDLHVFERVPGAFDPGRFDAVVYQIANNPYHAKFYDLALRHPGIVVLHEPNLHELIKGATVNTNDRQYLREVAYEIFGHELDEIATDETSWEIPQPRTFSILRRLLNHSRACIVHSRFAERQVRMKRFSGPIAVIPHGAEVRSEDAGRYRESIGIPANAVLIGIYGYQRPDKRTLEVLETFRQLLASNPDAYALVAGEPHPEMDFDDFLKQTGLAGRIKIVGFLEKLSDFDACLNACDIVVNLRNPTFGETSGTAMRALGMGKVVLVSDNGASSDIPDDVCLKIPDDRCEQPVLLDSLRWLAGDAGLRREIGARAQAWIARECTWRRAAVLYAEFIDSVAHQKTGKLPAAVHVANGSLPDADCLRTYLEKWLPDDPESVAYFRTHAKRLVRTLQLTPAGAAGERILEMGCYAQITPALTELLKYAAVFGCSLGPAIGDDMLKVEAPAGEFRIRRSLFNADVDTFPYADDYFATVLCCELLEHLEKDPMHMMYEIHRILKPGGKLVLTTPNIVSLRSVKAVLNGKHPASFRRYEKPHAGKPQPAHSREYTPDEVRLLLTDAGFLLNQIETGPYGDDNSEDAHGMADVLKRLGKAPDFRGDCIFVVGTKEQMPRLRYPVWLYGE